MKIMDLIITCRHFGNESSTQRELRHVSQVKDLGFVVTERIQVCTVGAD